MRRLSTCIVLPVVLACAQSDRLAQETIPTWSVASEPMVVIGGDADPAGALYRVGGATRLGAGYLIANSSEHELRLYAADGRLLRELGREGPGPGEFRGPRLVARLPNDSVAIFDGGNRRLSIVCDGARVCGEWVVPPPGNVIGIDGDFLLLEDVQGDAIEGASFDRHTYLGFRRNATEAVTLFALDGVARLTRRLEGRLVSMPVPLSRRPIVIMSDGAILVSNGNDSVVRVLDLDGLAASEWVLPVPVPTVTSDEFRIAIAERLQAIPANRQVMMRSLYEAMTPPEHRAPLATLLIDRHGLVWAALATDDLSHGQTWLVIGQGGDVRARVKMPPGVDVLEVGDDYVLVRWRDALDVEFVRVHTLARTAA